MCVNEALIFTTDSEAVPLDIPLNDTRSQTRPALLYFLPILINASLTDYIFDPFATRKERKEWLTKIQRGLLATCSRCSPAATTIGVNHPPPFPRLYILKLCVMAVCALPAPGNGDAGNGTHSTAVQLFRARICSHVGVEVHIPIER